MLGDGTLQLSSLDPGTHQFFAQANSNFMAIQTAQGGIKKANSGAAIVVGDMVAFNGSGDLVKADSNAAAWLFNAVGMALNAAGGAGVEVRYQLVGVVAFTHSEAPGKPVYLSDTAGALTATAPAAARIVGIYMPSNKIYLNCPGSWRAT